MNGRESRLLTVALTATRAAEAAHGYGRSRVMEFPHVLLEVEVPAEALAADLAAEGLLVVVRVHVEGEIVDLVEGLVADVALEGLHATMRELVVFEVALLMEALAAYLADVGLVVGVDARMRVEGGTAVEGLAACLALVRLLRRVDDLVPAQRACLPEALATDLTDERPCSRMHGHVSGEIVVSVEDLAALGAGEGLLFLAVARRVAWRRRRAFLLPATGADKFFGRT